jgi:hypothetical protein
MPGSIWFPFRQGDRSEYLALYVLSALGISIYVPRTEDIGADFYCSLARLDGQRMTFHSPFIVQVKSSSISTVSFGGLDKDGNWRKDEIGWLFSQELPLLICTVDKVNMRLNLYGTSILWEAWYTGGEIGRVSLVLGQSGSVTEASHPTYAEVPDWPAEIRNKRRCDLPLGPPIVSIALEDVENLELMTKYRDILTEVIGLEQRNITYRRLQVHFYSLIADYTTNCPIGITYMYAVANPVPGTNTKEQLESLAPILTTLALNYKAQGKLEDVNRLKSVMQLLPDGPIRNMIKANIPELFTES